MPVLAGKFAKHIVQWPLFEIAKAAVGDKVVGVVRQQVSYYAGAAEWYIESLLSKSPTTMTSEELFHLSYLYGELADAEKTQATSA